MVEHYWPSGLEEALDILAQTPASPCAGGSGWMTRRGEERSYLFLSRVGELRRFTQDNDVIRVGACLTLEQLLEKHNVPPVLKEVAQGVADPALRGQTTLGGTLVSEGPGSDLAIVALAAGGQVRLVKKGGERTLALRDFFQGRRELDLDPKELVAELILPREGVEAVTLRQAAGLRLAVCVRWEGETLSRLSVVFGGEEPLSRPELDKTLVGKTRDQISGELPTFVTAWEKAISAGRGAEDWLALARQALFHEFLDEQN